MTQRPVFTVRNGVPFYNVHNVTFDWAAGLSKSQKRKNIDTIHKAFAVSHPSKKLLEISSSSTNEFGVMASAFNLQKSAPSLGTTASVERIYQSSKVFRCGGPYTDILTMDSMSAKRDERLTNSGEIIGFHFEGVDYPANPQSAFYNYLYINALLENPEIAEEILKYDGFTDIAFNPKKSVSCQAKAAAVFVSLSRTGLIEFAKDFDSFYKIITMPPVTFRI